MEERPETHQHNIPAPRTNVMGREREVAEIERALSTTAADEGRAPGVGFSNPQEARYSRRLPPRLRDLRCW